MEQRTAAHIHLLARQLLLLDVDREGVAQLQAEFQALFLCQRDQPAEHRHRVAVLQILVKMMLVKGNVIKARLVKDCPRIGIAEDRGIAFNKGVEMLFRQQICRDPLDLVGRTAVQGRERHAAANLRRDTVDLVGVIGKVFLQSRLTFTEDRTVGRILQALDKAVDLFGSDALEIVTDAHIEHKAVGLAERIRPADDL